MKPKIKEVIVVEGKKDTERIQLAVEADTIETQGLALEDETLALIEHAQKTRGVIVFTDPDYPGETIRKQISQKIPGVKHAFIIPAEGVPRHKGTLGIEHASVETIQEALKGLYDISEEKTPTVSKTFLREMGLTGGRQAKALRIQLGEALRIGYTNGKQLQKRLTMFGITEEEVAYAMKKIKEEGLND
ncbi:MAG TPA: ribonuclease M5 [Candidatus Atopostipes pullistercoris]|uniref:Ribonuclease M5 n=1 Tax=Candidatus Atopostipes pullistercoris TaxID=2838467 RepID=A0A9D2G157_9LACT|nr:ribonuclease M5 [Candidatus Atopostipes pullistercoris]